MNMSATLRSWLSHFSKSKRNAHAAVVSTAHPVNALKVTSVVVYVRDAEGNVTERKAMRRLAKPVRRSGSQGSTVDMRNCGAETFE